MMTIKKRNNNNSNVKKNHEIKHSRVPQQDPSHSTGNQKQNKYDKRKSGRKVFINGFIQNYLTIRPQSDWVREWAMERKRRGTMRGKAAFNSNGKEKKRKKRPVDTKAGE